MGLVAWYPLNGSLEDYSGNGNNLIGTVTINNSGKIGKTYDFSDNYLTLKNPIKTNVFSISVWVKYNNNSTTQCIFCTRTIMGYGISLFNIGSTFRFDAGGQWLVPNYEISPNKWTHLTFVKDNNIKKIYIDGELHSTTSCSPIEYIFDKGTIGASQQSLGGYGNYLKGNLNDLRFYDEALSIKEIKEIAKAKILHYNFNQFVEPTENLYRTKSQISSSVVTPTWIDDHTVRFSSAGGTSGIYLNGNIVTEANNYYTLSYNLKKISGTLTHIRGHIDSSSGWSIVETKINDKVVNNYTYSNVLQDTFEDYKIEVVLLSNNATTAYYNWIQPNYNSATVVEVEISNIQFEKKKYSTPFTNDIRSNQKIKDNSGFRNHSAPLNLIETPQWHNSSFLGGGCYKFENAVKTSTGNYQHFKSKETIRIPEQGTISFYIKHEGATNSDNKYAVGFANFCSMNNNGTMGLIYYYDGSNYTTRTTSCNFYDGNWHMYTITWDSVTKNVKLYKDGAKQYDGSVTDFYHVGTYRYFLVGNAWGTSYGGHSGYLDDIRLYATALSEADVQELYQLRGAVSKNGKIMVNEVVENGHYNYESKGINLVRNGYGDYKNNTNMGGTFISTDFTPKSKGVFEYTGSGTVISSDYIKVNKQDIYKLSMYIKSMTENNKFYAGVACYDENKNFISHTQVNRVQSSCTTLAKPLNNGDTVVYLTSSSGWYIGTQGTYVYQKQMGIYNRLDATNYERTTLITKYTDIDTTNHTITLHSAWTGGSIPQGTKVANVSDGGSYNYVLANYETPKMDWYKKEVTISGWGVNNESKFRYGTEYIKILILVNYAQASTFKMRIGSISFINTSQLQSPEYNSKDNSQVNKRGQLFTTEIYENNYKPSLVDYSGWTLTSTGGWSNNGASSENCRVIYPNPRGNSDIMWATLTNDTSSNDDGGFHSPQVVIDKTKKYRFSVWIRRENVGSGRTYLGLNAYDSSSVENGLLKLDGTAITNPYFTHFLASETFGTACNNDWILLVGYVHPNSYSGSNDSTNGVYKQDGTRVGGITDYKWSTTASKTRIRSYLYYSTSTAERQYFYRPRIDLCDGSEPTIQELLSCNEHLPLVDMNGKPIPKNIFSFAKDGRTYSTEFIEN